MLTPLLAVTLAGPAVSQPDATGADCSCLWEGSFSEVAHQTDLVVLAEVQTSKGNAVDLVPERVLQGNFWRGCGFLCPQIQNLRIRTSES